MFSKSSDPTSAPQIPQRDGRNIAKSILGPDLEITGEIITSGELEILGRVEGNVAADSLSVGLGGKLSGSVRANNVEVKGEIDGRVDSQTFIMRASAQVTADVVYATAVIESGASMEGRFAKLR